MQFACQAGTRVQLSRSNTNNTNNQKELPTAQPYGVSDSPFPFKWVCGPQELESLMGGGKKEYARPGMNGGRVLYRQLLGEFEAVIKKPCPMGRKSNAR